MPGQPSRHDRSFENHDLGYKQRSDKILVEACRAMRRQSRSSERRYVRAMAENYSRGRHLNLVLGWTVPVPNGGDKDLTGRIIRAIGHRLHYQVSRGHSSRGQRIRLTRIALFGECLILKRQLANPVERGALGDHR